jgi:hypothetical protein
MSHVDHVYLLEDGLQLWVLTLQNAVAITPHLMELFVHLGPIAERDFDNLIECLRVISSYMLLGGDTFMVAHAEGVIFMLAGCLGNVRDHGLVAVAETSELLLQIFPAQGPALLADMLVSMLLALLQGASDAVAVAYTAVVGRVLCLDAAMFWGALGQVAYREAAGPSPMPNILGAIIDLWLPRLMLTSATASRKVRAVAAMSLILPPADFGADVVEMASGRSARVSEICLQVASELEHEEKLDCNVGDAAEAATDLQRGLRLCEAERRRALVAGDGPSHINLLQVLKEKLHVVG